MKNKGKILICFLVFSVIIMFLSGCVQNEMSCAGIKTYPICLNLCTKDAVTSCEAFVEANKKTKKKQYQQNNRNYQNRSNSNY